MTSNSNTDATSLTKSFDYSTSTHNFRIKWCSLGSAESPPLIFIHGTPWSSRVWKPFALSLSRQFHVYLFDNHGFGESPLESKIDGVELSSDKVVELDADLARQTEVFAALYKMWEKDWHGQKAHVVAHDHAGLMSLRAYLLHDCSYASLCLINVVAIGPFGQSLFKSVAENPQIFEQLPDSAVEGILESYIRDASFNELPKETLQMLKAPWQKKGGKAGFIRQLCQANWRNIDAVEEKYGEVGLRIPVKILWGADDSWIPVETAWRLGKALNAKEVVTIEGAGHLCMYDEPAQVGVELARWLVAEQRVQIVLKK